MKSYSIHKKDHSFYNISHQNTPKKRILLIKFEKNYCQINPYSKRINTL
jgi:hypothetical protein